MYGSLVISCTKWQSLASIPLYIYNIYIYISHDNLFENRGSRNPPSRYLLTFKFFLLSVWTTSSRFAKFQAFILILTYFLRHLNMAIFAKSYQFCITVLASFLVEEEEKTGRACQRCDTYIYHTTICLKTGVPETPLPDIC